MNRSHKGEVQCTGIITLACLIFELVPFVVFHTWILSSACPSFTTWGKTGVSCDNLPLLFQPCFCIFLERNFSLSVRFSLSPTIGCINWLSSALHCFQYYFSNITATAYMYFLVFTSPRLGALKCLDTSTKKPRGSSVSWTLDLKVTTHTLY